MSGGGGWPHNQHISERPRHDKPGRSDQPHPSIRRWQGRGGADREWQSHDACRDDQSFGTRRGKVAVRGQWVSVDVDCHWACGWGVPSPRPTAQPIGVVPGVLCERTRTVAGHGMAPDIIVVHVAPGLAATVNVHVIDSAAIMTQCDYR